MLFAWKAPAPARAMMLLGLVHIVMQDTEQQLGDIDVCMVLVPAVISR